MGLLGETPCTVSKAQHPKSGAAVLSLSALKDSFTAEWHSNEIIHLDGMPVGIYPDRSLRSHIGGCRLESALSKTDEPLSAEVVKTGRWPRLKSADKHISADAALNTSA